MNCRVSPSRAAEDRNWHLEVVEVEHDPVRINLKLGTREREVAWLNKNEVKHLINSLKRAIEPVLEDDETI